MDRRVAIVGLGTTPARPVSSECSYRELTYEAASRAYQDAGLEPKDVGTFVGCAEDFLEGTSIFDEYTPDQIGGARRPVHTISGDGIQGLAAAVLQIKTGLLDVALVEAHSKASNVLTLDHVLHFATDPVWTRPLGLHPRAYAAMEASRYMARTGTTREMLAAVVATNHGNALRNPEAAYGARLERAVVLNAPTEFDPLGALDFAEHADGAIVFVLAVEDRARALTSKPVWVDGTGWTSDGMSADGRASGTAEYARTACRMALKEAGIADPKGAFDLAEVSDEVSFKELQHLEAAGLFEPGEAGKAALEGRLGPGGPLPVNVSGGSLGMGALLEAAGAARVAEIVRQIRGEAGARQLGKAQRGLAVSWRGVPTQTGAALVLSAS